MEIYGRVLNIAMPIFSFLVLIEKWWGWRKGKDTVRNMDMISSLNSGITSLVKVFWDWVFRSLLIVGC